MSTSEFGYYVPYDTAVDQEGVADTALGPVLTRTLLNNVCHLSDEVAQCRVKWADKTGFTFATVTAPYTNTMMLAWQFPLTTRQNGDAYKLRIRLGGWVAGGATATFRAIVGQPGALGALRSWGGVGDAEFLTGSLPSSSAWVTGFSQGPLSSPDLLTLPAALVPGTVYPTFDTIGGLPISVVTPYAQLSIYATCTAGGTVHLTAVELQEYVGT